MAVQKQDDQHEHTFSSYVRIRDVVLKTYLGRWTIERSGERGSGISVLPARYDDDDIYIYIYIYIYIHASLSLSLSNICIHIGLHTYRLGLSNMLTSTRTLIEISSNLHTSLDCVWLYAAKNKRLLCHFVGSLDLTNYVKIFLCEYLLSENMKLSFLTLRQS